MRIPLLPPQCFEDCRTWGYGVLHPSQCEIIQKREAIKNSERGYTAEQTAMEVPFCQLQSRSPLTCEAVKHDGKQVHCGHRIIGVGRPPRPSDATITLLPVSPTKWSGMCQSGNEMCQYGFILKWHILKCWLLCLPIKIFYVKCLICKWSRIFLWAQCKRLRLSCFPYGNQMSLIFKSKAVLCSILVMFSQYCETCCSIAMLESLYPFKLYIY